MYWIELRFQQDYIDVQYSGFKNYGIWAHGKSTADGSPERSTTGPST